MAALFAASLSLYVWTLLPGLGGQEDTAKFQYIGPALGTAHEPGYPLYILLSFLFSKVPFGTLAWRINLLSAICGASAVALLFLTLRRLGVHAWVAWAAGAAFATGRTFWENSTFAEVYTLAAALTAATFLALLHWDDTGRRRYLYAAVMLASLAFGDHMIILGAVPALVLFVLLSFRGRVPPRVLAISMAIVAGGLGQYGYVWLRTVQGAAYLEAKAHSFSEFVDVLRAHQFAGMTFAEDPWVVLTQRIPVLSADLVGEMGLPAAIAALVGCAVLWLRRPRAGLLFVLSVVGVVVLLSMLGPVAVGPILLPACVAAWVLAGVAVDAVREPAARVTRRWVATMLAGVVASLIPMAHIKQNFAFNDRREDTYYTDYFRALFDRLPSRSGFIDEEYLANTKVNYQTFADGRTGVKVQVPRDPAVIRGLLRSGYHLFAFRYAHESMEAHAVFQPVQLVGWTLEQRARAMPTGRLVLLTGSAPLWPAAPALGLTAANRISGPAVVVAVAGVSSPPLIRPASGGAVLEFSQGEPLGIDFRHAPVPFEVAMHGATAMISLDGEVVAESDRGILVVEVSDRLESAYRLESVNGMRAPVDMRREPLYEIDSVADEARCTSLGGAQWTALDDPGRDGRLVGYINDTKARQVRWQLYLASAQKLWVRPEEGAGNISEPDVREELFEGPAGHEALRARLLADGVVDPGFVLAAPVVTRVETTIKVDGKSQGHVRLDLGGIASAAIGRATMGGRGDSLLRACALSGEHLHVANAMPGFLIPLGPDGEWYFGRGWTRPVAIVAGFERLTTAAEAQLLVPVEGPAPARVGVRLEPVGSVSAVEMLVNGRRVGERSPRSGMTDLSWDLPAGTWTAGLNVVTLRVVDGATRLRVRRIEVDQGGSFGAGTSIGGARTPTGTATRPLSRPTSVQYVRRRASAQTESDGERSVSSVQVAGLHNGAVPPARRPG